MYLKLPVRADYDEFTAYGTAHCLSVTTTDVAHPRADVNSHSVALPQSLFRLVDRHRQSMNKIPRVVFDRRLTTGDNRKYGQKSAGRS